MTRIRRAEAGDLARILDLEAQIFGDEAWPAEQVAFELSAPARLYLVAEPAPVRPGPLRSGMICGYAGVFLAAREAEVMTLAVDPAARGRGVGRALMDALLDAARAAGASRVGLTVADGLAPATALYRSLGFEPRGVARGYYQPSGRDGMLMRLDLH